MIIIRNIVLLAFLTRDHPISVAIPMGRRYLNVTEILTRKKRLKYFKKTAKIPWKYLQNSFKIAFKKIFRTHKNA